MIRLRREAQKTLWEGVVDEDVKALWEPWMIAVDALLSDEELVGQVYEAQGERHEKSRTRVRWQTAAETVLRLAFAIFPPNCFSNGSLSLPTTVTLSPRCLKAEAASKPMKLVPTTTAWLFL
jgi:hypothetical protein